jgi:glutamine amidotransferase
MTATIGIVDYGMGNLRSVQKAFERLQGPRAVLVGEPEPLRGCDKLVLPGVGNFADGMRQLDQRGLRQPLLDYAASGRPLLGVCMGMQLLMSSSTEDAPTDAPTPGLGLVRGEVVRFEEDQGPGRARLKVPHMGWNRLEPAAAGPMLRGLGADAYVYFVHGYYCRPADEGAVAATAGYGGAFCAALVQDNLWGMQFHPEKSQGVGRRLLENFVAI